MDSAAGADSRRRITPEATASSTSRGEAVVTAAAGLGVVCALAAAAGAWMLMTSPDRLLWATSDAGSMMAIIARTTALLTSAALTLVGG